MIPRLFFACLLTDITTRVSFHHASYPTLETGLTRVCRDSRLLNSVPHLLLFYLTRGKLLIINNLLNIGSILVPILIAILIVILEVGAAVRGARPSSLQSASHCD